MANIAISFLLLLGFIAAGASGGSMMCVKCSSLNDKTPGDCQKRPPRPSTCYKTNAPQFCLTAIEYNADNTQRQFVRDCTTVDQDSCSHATAQQIAAGAAAKICHEVCNTDGCNDSACLVPSVVVLSLSLLCLIVVVVHLHPLSVRL